MISFLKKQHCLTQVLVMLLMLSWSGTIPNKQSGIGDLGLKAKGVQQHSCGLFRVYLPWCLGKVPKDSY